MIKINCIVCDNPACRKVCGSTLIRVTGKKRELQYCSEKCRKEHHRINDKEIKRRMKALCKNPEYEFRFLMAGVYCGKPILKCDICEDMVVSTVQTAYHKKDTNKAIHICSRCYNIFRQ